MKITWKGGTHQTLDRERGWSGREDAFGTALEGPRAHCTRRSERVANLGLVADPLVALGPLHQALDCDAVIVRSDWHWFARL
ncbi:MAG: hypothetical protein QOG53_3490 [Frankiales bacterium]|nr:hypothetical protein [Frankiales bacterium]